MSATLKKKKKASTFTGHQQSEVMLQRVLVLTAAVGSGAHR